jgi:cephalosporin-C deacetylase
LNFARRIRVPGMYFQGYNDVVCPPTSVFAVYNLITAPKKLLLALEQGHAISTTQHAPINEWVYARIGLQ